MLNISVNLMFRFPEREVDFYLPQLVTMYITMQDVAEVLHPYLIYRCANIHVYTVTIVYLLWLLCGNGFEMDCIFMLILNPSMHRCRKSVNFSLQCAWLLDAYSSDSHNQSRKKSHGTKLRNFILSDSLR